MLLIYTIMCNSTRTYEIHGSCRNKLKTLKKILDFRRRKEFRQEIKIHKICSKDKGIMILELSSDLFGEMDNIIEEER